METSKSHRPRSITGKKPSSIAGKTVSTRSVYVSKMMRSQKANWKKALAAISRWLHIYLSMVSFAILLFFAVTGLTLNHPSWFEGKQVTIELKGKVQTQWVSATDTNKIAKLEIVEFFRTRHKTRGAVSEFRIDDSQCAISFKGPGYFANAYVDRVTGSYELSETRLGLMAVLNDLHKGRDSGTGWSLLIDISAILMTLVSLTGIIMIFFLKKKRYSGILVAILGAMLSVIIYKIFVR